MLIIGLGSITQAVLPLIHRHLNIKPEQITIIAPCDCDANLLKEYPFTFKQLEITQDNFQAIVGSEIQEGDFLLNLSVNVSSLDLIKLCHKKGANYLDTCIEPWPGGYTDASLSPSLRSNYGLREAMLNLKNEYNNKGKTALVAHGANPGLVSHFVKQGLLNIAKDNKLNIKIPSTKTQWAELAKTLNIKVIHIAEYDSQISTYNKDHDEFINTWSVDGFVMEGLQPAELGWGSHEKQLPADGFKHDFGCGAAIYLKKSGMTTKVKTWTPSGGNIHGFLITHNEAISIADYFSLTGNDNYRPTVHYSYRPCSDAIVSIHDFASSGLMEPTKKRVINSEITGGMDELGVLLMGNKKGVYWYGSQLSIKEARELCPFNSATSLQVAVGVLAGMIWVLENPNSGIIEAEDIDFNKALTIAEPYLGKMVGVYSDWNPLKNNLNLFDESHDDDVWQFNNFRVTG